MVYVLSENGQPLMPTKRYGKIRHLLKDGKAKVVNRCPFTIQLLYQTTTYTQTLELGVDAGSKTIGLSVSAEEKEYFSGEVAVRNDIVDLLSTRRQYRKSRHNRKTRYRAPRFNNRVHSKNKGWLAPSIENKCQSHVNVISKVTKILPISHITVELASFDTQKLKADMEGLKRPESTDYQQGEQLGFWNCREYVLFRDNHECQCCHGKSKDKILNVHHIESRKTGGNAPNNLITLCETCHKAYHAGKITLPKDIKRKASYKDASFMGIIRWAVYNKLKKMYPDKISITYGYITKNTRIANNLPKEHRVDALCIAGHPKAERDSVYYFSRKIRCHNRQIYKAQTLKGGVHKKNQAPKYVKGYQLSDTVSYKGKLYFVCGRRSSGFFDIRTLDGTKVNKGSMSYKKLELINYNKTYLREMRAS